MWEVGAKDDERVVPLAAVAAWPAADRDDYALGVIFAHGFKINLRVKMNLDSETAQFICLKVHELTNVRSEWCAAGIAHIAASFTFRFVQHNPVPYQRRDASCFHARRSRPYDKHPPWASRLFQRLRHPFIASVHIAYAANAPT
jgi:hypothetical protein